MEDKLRIAPCTDCNGRSSVADQHVTGGFDRRTIDVGAHKERPVFDAFLPAPGLVRVEAGVLERA